MKDAARKPAKPRPLATFLMSWTLGGIYAAICWIHTSSQFWANPIGGLPNLIAVGLIFGVPVGFLCSPFVVMWLDRKNIRPCGVILLFVVPATYP